MRGGRDVEIANLIIMQSGDLVDLTDQRVNGSSASGSSPNINCTKKDSRVSRSGDIEIKSIGRDQREVLKGKEGSGAVTGGGN